jgi:hypothetical protein
VRGIAFTEFSAVDVVRHPLVARIIDAYEKQASDRPSRKASPRVAVQYACRAAGAPSAPRLRSYARAARPAAIDVTLRVVGAAEGRRLNRNYRGADRATNVLAFASGDIVLCHPIVVREARLRERRCKRTTRTWSCTPCCTCEDTRTIACATPSAWKSGRLRSRAARIRRSVRGADSRIK